MPKNRSRTRVLLCTNSGICATLSLQALLSSGQVEVAGIFLSKRTRTKNGAFISDLIRMIRTSGLEHTLYLALGTAFFDICRLPGFLPTIKNLAKKQGISVFSNKDINSDLSKAWINEIKPEVLLSSYFNQKIAPDTLSIPNRNSVNIHPSLLPAYKGVDPVFYYILNRETSLGVTLHQLDSDFDTGKILSQKTIPTLKNHSVFWHTTELFREGMKLFLIWLDKHSNEILIEHTDTQGSYDSWPSKTQVKQLGKRLYNIKDFNEQSKRPFQKKQSS